MRTLFYQACSKLCGTAYLVVFVLYMGVFLRFYLSSFASRAKSSALDVKMPACLA
jgi:hypothetical protein